MFRYFKRHGWLWALIAFLLLFPQALTSQARLNNRVLITGLAIDRTEAGFEVTAQVVLPTPGSESGGEGANLDFISEEGVSVIEGLKKISYNIGEIAGLSHANFVIIGESVFDGNVISDLDYFLRDAHLPNSIMVVYCEGSAKEQIKKTGDLELSVGLGLQKIYLYKQQSLNSRMVAMQEFVDNVFEQSGVSILPELKITKEGEDDSSSSGSNSSDGGSSSSSQSSSGGASGGTSSGSGSGGNSEVKQGRIEYFTPLAYFKKGYFVDKITEQKEIIAYLLTQQNSNEFNLVIENVDDGDIYHNAKVSLRVGKKTAKIRTDFSGGKPVAKVDIALDKIKFMEVVNENVAYQGAYSVLKPYLNETLISAIKSQITETITSIFEKTKAQNVDLFRVADISYRFNRNDWEEYLLSLGDIDNYLNDFDIEINVNVKSFI